MRIEEVNDSGIISINGNEFKEIYNDLLNNIKDNDKKILEYNELINTSQKQRLCSSMGVNLLSLLLEKCNYTEKEIIDDNKETKNK